ncbi:hypothetical protein [Acidocella sp.]|uniref:hypothetical protein n=1 Tax=Acidocella sp. TaxID=50710 RepID=UPI002606D84A|nr:hypothetical protein [Acidocella sp.]
MCSMLNGCALIFDRLVLAQIGFMDSRFGRYGHEHTELTLRTVRAGYGGGVLRSPEGDSHLFKVIEGGLEALAVGGHGSQAEADANHKVMVVIRNDPVYRHAWHDDQAMATFLAEQDEALLAKGQTRP